jgi:hypothetical protein
MILYHGSSNKFSAIRKSQAQAGEGVSVPEGELLDAIYLTPDIEFAVAVAAKPRGGAQIDSENKTVEFEHPELFDPARKIYIYEVESGKIPADRLRKIDREQYAVVDTDEIMPDRIRELRAEEILRYYRLTNWDGGSAHGRGNLSAFRGIIGGMNKSTQHAILAAGYISLIGHFFFWVSHSGQSGPDNMIIPMAMLALLVLSVAIMSYLFFYEPALLLADGKKAEAMSTFLRTVAKFAVITVVYLVLAIFVF